MLEQINIPTLFIATAITTLILFAILVFVAATRRVYPGFRLWILGMALVCVSAVITSATAPQSGLTDPGGSWLLSWIVALSAVIVVHAGVRRFRGRSAIDVVDIIVVLLSLLIAAALTARGQPDEVRLVAVAFPAAFVLLRAATTSATRVRLSLRPAYFYFAGVYLALALLFIVRSALALLDPQPFVGNTGLSHLGEVLFFTGGSVLLVAWSFGALLVTGQRQETEMLDLQAVLRDQAGTDFLTGLANRRRFFEESRRLLAERSEGDAISVLLGDVDHFKKINDSFGHEVGDLGLRNVSRALRREAPAEALVGRIGGEEFALMVPLDAPAAVELAEHLRHRIASDRHEHTLRRPVTMSFGVESVTDAEHELDLALSRADSALYQAKRLGRNRVESFDAESGEGWIRRLRQRERSPD